MSLVNRHRGRIEELELKKSIKINSSHITKALIEIDHINYGLDKTGRLKRHKRSNFSVKDIEKFIMIFDLDHNESNLIHTITIYPGW